MFYIIFFLFTYVNSTGIVKTEEEMKAIRDKAKAEKLPIVEELGSRRTGKREHEYEVIWEGLGRGNFPI
jgi:arsenate reductase-like glutaredoxin family protein